MNPHQHPDPLSRLLADWRLAARTNPDFRVNVWTRVSTGAANLPWGEYVRRHAAPFGSALALAIALGAVIGHEHAKTRAAEDSARLASVYVLGLDARTMTTP